MNDDIKEIFAYFKRYMSIKDCSKVAKIEDYIANLQQRIEKAIKYLNNKNIYDNEYGEFIYYQYLIHDHLIDILNGRSDE